MALQTTHFLPCEQVPEAYVRRHRRHSQQLAIGSQCHRGVCACRCRVRCVCVKARALSSRAGIPQPELIAAAERDQLLVGGRVQHMPDVERVLQDGRLLPRDHVAEQHAAVVTSGGQGFAVRRESDRHDRGALGERLFPAAGRVPQQHTPVLEPQGQRFAVRGKRHGINVAATLARYPLLAARNVE